MTARPATLHHLGLALATALALAACSQETPAPATTDAAPADSAATGAPAAAAPAAEAPARTPGPVVPPTGPAPVAGQDYVVIPGGSQFTPGDDIEVVEVFGYTCPHCATFEPLVSSWAAKLPADVGFEPVAAAFGGYWEPYAKAFYAAQAMGVAEQSHDAVFKAIHVDRSLPVQPLPTDEQIGQFYAQFGVDPKQFASTMSSFAVKAKLNQAGQFLQRSGVDSTPVLIVDGKYRVTGRSHEENLRIAEHLVAMERAAGATAEPAAPVGDAASTD
ncbi:thiol:disulfide interchange protein DsbA/DsbL [Novilysobacter arseniciresistens]|uniref:thiol:disulfide interchange protein DsbA/DsbL n=1 Tax=Novilysobacter arseniciresistens TaxID=1385522 RepID=UPI000691EB20|nr:thiol:disulfide interchange protein DsbA/DsbL [Lysobacter arseniciresistens]